MPRLSELSKGRQQQAANADVNSDRELDDFIESIIEPQPQTNPKPSALPDETKAESSSGSEPNIAALREQLFILVSSGHAHESTGVKLTHDKVQKLSDKDVIKLSQRHQAFVASKMNSSLVDSFVTIGTQLVAMVVPIKDLERYQAEIRSDYIINRELCQFFGGITSSFQRASAFATAALITLKNIGLEEPLRNTFQALRATESTDPFGPPAGQAVFPDRSSDESTVSEVEKQVVDHTVSDLLLVSEGNGGQ